MTLNIVSSFNGVSDPDAAAYIEAVEAADGELLEFAVGKAINDFVLGCKADGIWDAIKASCILAGARTLNGALVPLAGAAPTNPGGVFVDSDYNRKTGLVGDGSTKYLNSNRNNNADPQNSNHNAVFMSTKGSSATCLMGVGGSGTIGANQLIINAVGNIQSRNRVSVAGDSYNGSFLGTGFVGTQRVTASEWLTRFNTSTAAYVGISGIPASGNLVLFGRGTAAAPELLTDSRLAFYSIGEALDLAKLDARVTTLINAFGVAIP